MPNAMRQFISVTLLFAALATIGLQTNVAAQEVDYFPLQLGNKWTYKDRGETRDIGYDIAVSDSLRLDVGFFNEDQQLGSAISEIPTSSDGILYFVLKGSVINVLLGQDIDSILIRKGHINPYTYTGTILSDNIDEVDFANMIWIRGILQDNSWLLFNLDRPLWLPKLDDGVFFNHWTCFRRDDPDCGKIQYFVSPPPDVISIDDTVFSDISYIFGDVDNRAGHQLFFSPGIGLIKIGTWNLFSAEINGKAFPFISDVVTQLNMFTWGKIKNEQIQADIVVQKWRCCMNS